MRRPSTGAGAQGRARLHLLSWLALLLAVIAAALWWASEPGRPLAHWRAGQGTAADPLPGAARPHGADRGGERTRGGSGPGSFGVGAEPLVSVAEVRRQDIRVTVDAIGTVAARRTALVQTRVDGDLLSLHFIEGEAVHAGQLLARLDPEPFRIALAQAAANLARDRAQLAAAQRDLERFQGLLAKDAIAHQQVDNQRALAAQLEATVRADQALVDEARLQLSYTEIKAPIDGIAGLRRVDPGNRLRTSDAQGIVSIVQIDPVDVVFAVPAAVLPRIVAARAGGRSLEVSLFDQDGAQQIAQGHLATIDNTIDVATGSIRARAEFANPDATLFPNQFVNVRVEVELQHDRLAVPVAAIQRTSQGATLSVVLPDLTLALRTVETGARDGEWIAVDGELAVGERVVIDGAERVPAGARVRIAGRGAAEDADAPH